MLAQTYIHAQSIGRITEQKLWQAGAKDWQTYLSKPDNEWPLSKSQRSILTPTIELSQKRLASEDFAWFAEQLPQGEHWRATPEFGHRLAFVDIETTGDMGWGEITVIGVYDGYRLHQFIQGKNLQDFPKSLADTAMVVTFYGTGFDIPCLQQSFPRWKMNQFHVDLCFLFKKLGYKGGLKSIERQLGLERSVETTGLSGLDAIQLWREYRRGRKASLDTLLSYNAEDVRNLAKLLAIGYQKMRQNMEGEIG